MSVDSILQTGSFTQTTGKNKTLKIRSDVDKIVIENETQWAASNNGYGFRYTWYRDMGTTMLMEFHPAADHTSAVNTTTSAIELIDTSDYALGASYATTDGTDATRPVYSTGTTTGLANGAIVRVFSGLQTNLNGLDFSIDDLNAGADFRLANTLATTPGLAAGAGTYRMVAPNIEVYRMFTPSNRNIANITAAASAVVTTLVDHGYAIGQQVKFSINSEAGMIELDGVTGNITAISTSTFTVDVDTTAMTAFKFPLPGDTPCQMPSVVPVGDAKSSVSQTAPSAFLNQGYIGVVLTAGTTGPAGNDAGSGDVIRWTAYKVEHIDDE